MNPLIIVPDSVLLNPTYETTFPFRQILDVYEAACEQA
jgi:hypothetical protein